MLEIFTMDEMNLHDLDFGKLQKDVIELILVGDQDCGKTEIIHNYFGDYSTFVGLSGDTWNEYRVVSTDHLEIVIRDVKDVKFVARESFREKSAFLFCYDAENSHSFESLETTWIPAVKRRLRGKLRSRLVGITRQEQSEAVGASSQQPGGMPSSELVEFWREFNIDPSLVMEITGGASQRPVGMSLGELRQFCNKKRIGRPINCSTEDIKSLQNVFQVAVDCILKWNTKT